MRIACVGGGPAGLYFALLLKRREPRHNVTIFERSVPGATRGWGVVFWGDLLEKLYSADPESACVIEQASFPWDGQVVDVQGEQVVYAASLGYGIKRQRLLDILVNRALDAGVHIEFDHEVTTAAQLPPVDLIVACDGVNSRIRQETNGIHTDVRQGNNKYIWLGTDKVFKTFTFPFVQTDSGWIWAHAYGVDAESSTFIVECSAETWTGLGFDALAPEDCLSLLENIFESQLDGHRLIGQTSGERQVQWLNFRTVTNKHWYDGRTVLAGDAAHTTHFTIGSGTRLAIEDAIALADNLQQHGEIKPALKAYQRERQVAILPPQIAARFSSQWFENIPRYMDLKPHQFATLLQRRRSPLLPHLSPQLYYRLYTTSDEIRVLRDLRRWVGPKVVNMCGGRTRLLPLCRGDLVGTVGRGESASMQTTLHEPPHDIRQPLDEGAGRASFVPHGGLTAGQSWLTAYPVRLPSAPPRPSAPTTPWPSRSATARRPRRPRLSGHRPARG